MKDTEQLELEYLRIKNDRDLHLFDEKLAHKNVIECEEKMRLLERDIKAFEEDNLKNKLNDCVDFIKQYCTKAKCDDCQFNAPYDVCNLAKPPIDW